MVLQISFRKLALIEKAKKKYDKIQPVGMRKDFFDCFTEYKGENIFWFDTPDGDTHIVKEDNTGRIPCAKGDPDCNALINFTPEVQKEQCSICVNKEKTTF